MNLSEITISISALKKTQLKRNNFVRKKTPRNKTEFLVS